MGIKVSMPRGDWEIVAFILADARDSGRFAYFDNIITTIDHALDTQEG